MKEGWMKNEWRMNEECRIAFVTEKLLHKDIYEKSVKFEPMKFRVKLLRGFGNWWTNGQTNRQCNGTIRDCSVAFTTE